MATERERQQAKAKAFKEAKQEEGKFGGVQTPSGGGATGGTSSSEERIAARQRVVAEQQAAGLGASIRQQVVGQLVQRKQARTTAQQIQAQQQRDVQPSRPQDVFQQQPGQRFIDAANRKRVTRATEPVFVGTGFKQFGTADQFDVSEGPEKLRPIQPRLPTSTQKEIAEPFNVLRFGLGKIGVTPERAERFGVFVTKPIAKVGGRILETIPAVSSLQLPELAEELEKQKDFDALAPSKKLDVLKQFQTKRRERFVEDVSFVGGKITRFPAERPFTTLALVGGGAAITTGVGGLAATFPGAAPGIKIGADILAATTTGATVIGSQVKIEKDPTTGKRKIKERTRQEKVEFFGRVLPPTLFLAAGGVLGAKKILPDMLKPTIEPVGRSVIRQEPTGQIKDIFKPGKSTLQTEFVSGEGSFYRARTDFQRIFNRPGDIFAVKSKGITITTKKGGQLPGAKLDRTFEIFKYDPKATLGDLQGGQIKTGTFLRVATGKGSGTQQQILGNLFKKTGIVKGGFDVKLKDIKTGDITKSSITSRSIFKQSKNRLKIFDITKTGKTTRVGTSRLLLEPTTVPRAIRTPDSVKIIDARAFRVGGGGIDVLGLKVSKTKLKSGFGIFESSRTFPGGGIQSQKLGGGGTTATTILSGKVGTKIVSSLVTPTTGKTILFPGLIPRGTKTTTRTKQPTVRLLTEPSTPLLPKVTQKQKQRPLDILKVSTTAKTVQRTRRATAVISTVKQKQAILPKLDVGLKLDMGITTKQKTGTRLKQFENFLQPTTAITPVLLGGRGGFGRRPRPLLPPLLPATALFGRGRGRGRRALRQPTRFQTSFTGSSLRITAKKKPRLGGALAIRPIITSGALFKKAVKKKTKKRRKKKKK